MISDKAGLKQSFSTRASVTCFTRPFSAAGGLSVLCKVLKNILGLCQYHRSFLTPPNVSTHCQISSGKFHYSCRSHLGITDLNGEGYEPWVFGHLRDLSFNLSKLIVHESLQGYYITILF